MSAGHEPADPWNARRNVWVSAAACAVVALVLATPDGRGTDSGSAATTAVVDRTWSCPVRNLDGYRLIEVGASPAQVITATMHVTDELAPGPQSGLVFVEAGPNAGRPTGGMTVNRRCAVTKTRIALVRRGLPGPPSVFANKYDCQAPRRILVRVRAVVSSRGSWVSAGPSYRALKRNVSNAQMAVQTPTRHPLAYVGLEGEKTRVWVSPACVRD